jgi:thioredoxin 2
MSTDKVLVKCAQCTSLNRVRVERVGQTGKCGSCHADLPTRAFYADSPLDLDDSRFDLVTRTSTLPVFVDFWTPTCGPCVEMAPAVDALAHEMAGRALVVKVDAQASPMLSMRFAIEAVPTLIILRSGLEVDRSMGAQPLPALRARLGRFLS